jgi:hypothetical protein
MPNTVRLHRVLATSPEKVYRAFLEADALAKWLPPNGFACTVHHLEPKVGGTFKMSFRNFTTGKSHAFGGEYVELVPANACATLTNSTIPICLAVSPAYRMTIMLPDALERRQRWSHRSNA